MSRTFYCLECKYYYCKDQTHHWIEMIACDCGCNERYSEISYINHCYADPDFEKWLDVVISDDAIDVVRWIYSVVKDDLYSILTEDEKKMFDLVNLNDKIDINEEKKIISSVRIHDINDTRDEKAMAALVNLNAIYDEKRNRARNYLKTHSKIKYCARIKRCMKYPELIRHIKNYI